VFDGQRAAIAALQHAVDGQQTTPHARQWVTWTACMNTGSGTALDCRLMSHPRSRAVHPRPRSLRQPCLAWSQGSTLRSESGFASKILSRLTLRVAA
jgi:hypothetical protein